MSRVLDDGNDVRPVRGHVHKIATASVAELDGIHNTRRSDDVGDVADRRSAGRTEVEDLRAGLHEDVLDATENSGRKLGPERVPDAVLRQRRGSKVAIGTGAWRGRRRLDRYPLL